jgi:ferredoxin
MGDALTISLPSGESFTALPGENLLAAAQRAHWLVRYGCRNGNCAACEAQLLTGSIQLSNEIIVTADTPRTILLCQCAALSDLTLRFAFDPHPGSIAQSRQFYAQLIRITAGDSGYELEFALPAGRKPPVRDGQYASIELAATPLHLAIAVQDSAARRLILKSRAATALIVGAHYHVRYPLAAGHQP